MQPACPSLMHACTHVELLPLPPPAFCLVPAAMRADPRSPLQAHTLDFRCLPCCVFFVLQCVLTPAAPYMSKTNEEIAAETDRQVGAAALGARSSRLGRLNECWAGRLFAPQSKAELPPSRLIPTTSFLSPPLPALCCCSPLLPAGAQAVPQLRGPQPAVAQHCEDRAEPVPRGAGDGPLPPRPAHPYPQLLPGGVIHQAGLHRQVGQHGGQGSGGQRGRRRQKAVQERQGSGAVLVMQAGQWAAAAI